MSNEKKILLVTSTGSAPPDEYMRMALEEAGFTVDIRFCPGVGHLDECTDHIKAHGQEYAAAIMMHVGDYVLGRQRDEASGVVPAMGPWITDAQRSIPRLLVFDNAHTIRSSAGLVKQLEKLGIPLLDNYDSSPSACVDALQALLEPASEKLRQRHRQ